MPSASNASPAVDCDGEESEAFEVRMASQAISPRPHRAAVFLNLYAIFMLLLGYSNKVDLRAFAGRSRRWTGYAWSFAAAAACTAAGMAMTPLFEPVNIVMIYLLAV